ncbi:DUF1453 family protein [Rhizobium sp. CRIBSB]|nr:DUF1453 family protein [Rhizobium sp. CRIBSB]
MYGPLIGLLVAVLVILLRNRRPRILHPERLWVLPAIIVPLMGLAIWGTSMDPSLSHAPFGLPDWGVLAAGLLLGGAFGWWRGKMTTIEVHPGGVLKAQASPLGLSLIIAVMMGRRALNAVVEPHAAEWGLSGLAVADAFLVFVVGMIVMQRVEMFIRARRIGVGEPDSHASSVA